MIRIGMIGSDNSHAVSYSKLVNIKDKAPGKYIPGARVVALFGLEDKRNQEVAQEVKIPTIVKRHTDMLGMVDAVIVDFRHGGLHYQYAAPFLKAGIPTFVDKPLACSVPHAKKIIALAKKHRAPLMSCSAVRYGERIDDFKKKMKDIGKVRAGLLTGRGSSRGPYGGIFFYGVHSVEMLIEIFGNKIKSVRCTEHDGSAIASVTFRNGSVIVLNVVEGSNVPFTVGAFGTEGIILPDGEMFTGYYSTMKVFLKMVKTGKPPVAYDDLLLSVRILDAMQKSMDKDGKEIVLK